MLGKNHFKEILIKIKGEQKKNENYNISTVILSQAFSLAIPWQNADEYNPRPKAIPWQDASYTVTSCPQGYSETTGTETSKGEVKK